MFKLCKHEYTIIDKYNLTFCYQAYKKVIVQQCSKCGKIKKNKIKLI